MPHPLAALAFGLFAALAANGVALAATVKVTVNDIPITDVQIQQRAKLMTLEHTPGNLTTAATDELVNEALENQEAARFGFKVTDAQVQDQILTMSRGLRVSTDKLTLILNSAGVGLDTLKDRIRATLAWNQVIQNVITPRVTFSEADLAQQAATKITAAQSFDYILQQVTFLSAKPGSRTADANRYRAQYKGCSSAVQLSQSFTDAAVIVIGRRNATQLPEAVAAELASLPVGGITAPHSDPSGTIMLAVCEKDAAKDLTFITNQLRSDEGNDKLKTQTDSYLADLKSKAKIVSS